MKTDILITKFLFCGRFALLFFTSSCLPTAPEHRLYVKSIEIDSTHRIDWYTTSTIGGWGPGMVILNTTDKEYLIIKSHRITDLKYEKDRKLLLIEGTKELEVYNDLDTMNVGVNLRVAFSLKGFYMNKGPLRLDRLRGNNVDINVPHQEESDF